MMRTTRGRVLAVLLGAGLGTAAVWGIVAHNAVTSPVAVESAIAAPAAPGGPPVPSAATRTDGSKTAAIASISPTSALRGATVTISGAGFGAKRGAGLVRFGTAKCVRYLSWGATRITCRVPAAAAFGALAVTVRTARGTTCTTSFAVTEPGPTPTPTPTSSPVTEPFALTSSAFADGGTLPIQYSGDGIGISPPLAWTGVPEGTVELALMMTTQALDGEKWNWVLYGIPASVTSLAEGTQGVGITGLSTDGPELRYYPPMSKGPGLKTYTFTLYALSAAPQLAVPAEQVNGPALTTAISQLTLASTQLSVGYTRVGISQ